MADPIYISFEPETSPFPVEGTSPLPAGDTTPAPAGDATPEPEELASPAPAGDATPVPEELASPTPGAETTPVPEEHTTPAPAEGDTPQQTTAPTATDVPQEVLQESTPEPQTITEEPGPLPQWLTEPAVGGISCGGWTGLGLLAGLLVASAAAYLARRAGRKKETPAAPAAPAVWSGKVTVEKLHEQGARSGQQDCFFVSPQEETLGLLAVVADGMGGLTDGDKVSQAAVSAMAQAFYHAQGTPQQVLLRLAEQANSAVNRLLGEDGTCQSGSTLTAGLIRNGGFHYLSVGDSRICLCRQGVLYQLNREHIYRNELYTRFVNGEETLEGAAGHPQAAGLTSFLGMGQLKYIDLPAEPVTVQPGDRFLLMSDGVYNALSPEEMTAALAQGPGRTAQALHEAIQAKGYQNQDNYTAVILNC